MMRGISKGVLIFYLLFMAVSVNADHIKIGVICPSEGPIQGYGNEILYGVKAAISSMKLDGLLKPDDQIDILHHNTSTIPKDILVKYSDGSSMIYPASKSDRNCSPGMSAAAATNLANDNVHFVIGAYCSSTTEAAALILNQNKIPLITPASISKRLTEKKLRYLFRVCNREDYEGKAILKFVSQKLLPKSAFILNSRFSGIDEKDLSELTENGIQISGYELPEQIFYSNEELSKIIEKIAAQKPEAVILLNEKVKILKAIRGKGLPCHVLMTASPDDPIFNDRFKPLMEGVYVAARNYDVTTDQYIQFREEFQKVAAGQHIKPGPTAAFAYDGTILAVKALLSTPSSDPEQYRSAIMNTSYQGVSKHIQFYPNGDSTTDVAVNLMREGKLIPYWTIGSN